MKVFWVDSVIFSKVYHTDKHTKPHSTKTVYHTKNIASKYPASATCTAMPSTQINRHVVTACCDDVMDVWEKLLAVLMVVLINRDKPQGGKRAPFIRLWVDAAIRELVGYIHLNSTTGGLRDKLRAAGIMLTGTGVRTGEDRGVAGPLEAKTGLTHGDHKVPAIDQTDQVRADLAIKINETMSTIKKTTKRTWETFLHEWRAANAGEPTDQDYADYLLARVESCRRYDYVQGTYYEVGEPCQRPGNPVDDAAPPTDPAAAVAMPPAELFAAMAMPPIAPAAAFQELFGVPPEE